MLCAVICLCTSYVLYYIALTFVFVSVSFKHYQAASIFILPKKSTSHAWFISRYCHPSNTWWTALTHKIRHQEFLTVLPRQVKHNDSRWEPRDWADMNWNTPHSPPSWKKTMGDHHPMPEGIFLNVGRHYFEPSPCTTTHHPDALSRSNTGINPRLSKIFYRLTSTPPRLHFSHKPRRSLVSFFPCSLRDISVPLPITTRSTLGRR